MIDCYLQLWSAWFEIIHDEVTEFKSLYSWGSVISRADPLCVLHTNLLIQHSFIASVACPTNS